MAVDELRPFTYVRTNADAVAHAMRVASGLDSLVLGEDQIQSQWKKALAHAREARTLGPVLDRLASSALACGKRVRTFTGIGQHAVSIESLGIQAALDMLGEASLADRRCLVIGAGESAAIVVRLMRAHGAASVTVMTRSFEKAEAFALEHVVQAARMDEIASILPALDLVVCCTAAPHPVLGRAHFDRWAARAADRLLVCVDLGMPRDIEEAVAAMRGVRIVAMDQLSALAAQHREERRAHVPAAEVIVATEGTRFLEWKASRGGAATVARLHAAARGIADLETDVALARLPRLSTEEREIVRGMARRIVNKLLHAPSVALRSHAEAENIALALECAFGLRGAERALADALPHEPSAEPAEIENEEIA